MPKIQNAKPTAPENESDIQELLKSHFYAPAPAKESSENYGEKSEHKESQVEGSEESSKLEGSTTVLIEVPLSAHVMHHEFPVHVDFRLTPPQSTNLRRLVFALDRQQATLKSGARVVNLNSAVKWLIEQLG